MDFIVPTIQNRTGNNITARKDRFLPPFSPTPLFLQCVDPPDDYKSFRVGETDNARLNVHVIWQGPIAIAGTA